MKKKIVLIATLAIALILPLTISVEKADADAILFPWLALDSDISTIISIVNTAEALDGQDPELHYEYYHKPDITNDQGDTCQNSSFKRPTSKDDLVTFDAAGNINSGKPMFNDPGAGIGVTYGTNTFKLNVDLPRRAYLLVDNNTPSHILGTPSTNVDGTMYGEAMVIDLDNGAAWGYIAYNASGGAGTSQSGDVDFGDGMDVLGEVIGELETTQTVLMNPTTIGTRFFLTPADSDNQRKGNTESNIDFCITPDGNGECLNDNRGIWLNDEDSLDFKKTKNIDCTSGDDVRLLLSEAAWNTLIDEGRHGWVNIVINANQTPDDPDGMIIGKLEWTATGITFEDVTVSDPINNFVWLRDSGTVAGVVGINAIHNCQKTPGTCDLPTN